MRRKARADPSCVWKNAGRRADNSIGMPHAACHCGQLMPFPNCFCDAIGFQTRRVWRRSIERQPADLPNTRAFTVFLGDQGVGKTSIITRFMYDSFEKSYQVRGALIETKREAHRVVSCPWGEAMIVALASLSDYVPLCFPPPFPFPFLTSRASASTGHDRDRLPVQDDVLGGPDRAAAALGHGGARVSAVRRWV